jgi:hypothetical protein
VVTGEWNKFTPLDPQTSANYVQGASIKNDDAGDFVSHFAGCLKELVGSKWGGLEDL